jgi:hypothetical protein
MWKNYVQHMRNACWVTKATNTHSGCAILIAFPQQLCLQERTSMLRYTYIACLALDTVAAELSREQNMSSVSFLEFDEQDIVTILGGYGT